MPTYEITAPDGSKYEVSGPGTEQEALAQVQAQLQLQQQPAVINPDTMQPEGVPEFQPVGVEGYDSKTGDVTDGLDAKGTFAAAMPEGVPVIGPLLDKGAMTASAGIGSMISGDPMAKVRAEMEAMKAAGNEAHPIARMGGNVTGALATLGPIGATRAGGYALGVRGPSLLGRTVRSGASTGAISAADTAARGGDVADVAGSAGIGTALGAAFPVIGAGIGRGIGAIGDRAAPFFGAAKNPTAEAERRMGVAMRRDATANPGATLNAADEAVADSAGIPLINVDRGGETTRALARSAGNQSPEARAMIEKTASDRFGGQSQRASTFISKIMGGNVDDLAYQESIRDTARRVNKPAYDRAFAQPGAQAMWSPELQQLMQAPALQRAAMQSTTRGANRAAVEGFSAIKNPFHQAKDGSFKLRQKADGTLVAPTLQFWDQTKRNLDSMIGKAKRAGDNTLAGDITALKSQLVKTLDTAVPEYQVARQGAAAFFGAEDALEAGKKFVMTPKAIPEARKAFQKFSGADRKAFATGYASELIDKIKASPDRLNVVNSIFKSQAARESIELALGRQKAKQIEAYVRVETIVDQLRGAMGNSTTARQLVELGIGATGGGLYTGDLQGAVAGAALVAGPRYVRNRVEQNVMKELGKLLTKDDPALVQRLIHNASISPKYMKAIENIGNMLAAPSRVGAIEAARPASR